MKEEDNFSINDLKQYSLGEAPRISTLYHSSHKASSLFQSLISTNFIEKSPFDFEPFREGAVDFQAEEVDLLKLEEMLPKLSIEKKADPKMVSSRKKGLQAKQDNFSISERSEEDQSEYEALNRRKHKKPNRSVQGSTKNMLITLKGMIQSYFRREKLCEDEEFFPKGYVNLKQLEWFITSSRLRPFLCRMFEQRYLQRAIVASSISLQHKMLYLKKIKKIQKWSASIQDP